MVIRADFEGHRIPFIIDTGSEVNCVSAEFWARIKGPAPYQSNTILKSVHGITRPSEGLVKNIPLWFGQTCTLTNLFVIRGLPFAGILGRAWQQDCRYQQWDDPEGTHGQICNGSTTYEFYIRNPIPSLNKGGMVRHILSLSTDEYLNEDQNTQDLSRDGLTTLAQDYSVTDEEDNNSSNMDDQERENHPAQVNGYTSFIPAPERQVPTEPTTPDPAEATYFYHGVNAQEPVIPPDDHFYAQHVALTEIGTNSQSVLHHGFITAREWRVFPMEQGRVMGRRVLKKTFIGDHAQFVDIYNQHSEPCTAIVDFRIPAPESTPIRVEVYQETTSTSSPTNS